LSGAVPAALEVLRQHLPSSTAYQQRERRRLADVGAADDELAPRSRSRDIASCLCEALALLCSFVGLNEIRELSLAGAVPLMIEVCFASSSLCVHWFACGLYLIVFSLFSCKIHRPFPQHIATAGGSGHDAACIPAFIVLRRIVESLHENACTLAEVILAEHAGETQDAAVVQITEPGLLAYLRRALNNSLEWAGCSAFVEACAVLYALLAALPHFEHRVAVLTSPMMRMVLRNARSQTAFSGARLPRHVCGLAQVRGNEYRCGTLNCGQSAVMQPGLALTGT
jgi:hypothetical protein